MKAMPKIALGAWSWGAGAAGGDQVFGSHLFEDDLRPVFDKALECGLNLWDTAAVYGEGEEPLAELLDKGLVIGVVPDLLPRLSGVLLFGAVVRPGHPVQVWDVLDLVIIGRNRNVSVDVCIVITRHRVGRAQKIGHISTP